MMNYKFYKIFLSFFLLIFFSSCENKFDITQFNANTGNTNIAGDTLYVQTGEAIAGFNHPEDIIIGKEPDPFIYVADTQNDRVVLMNRAGQILGFKSVKKPVAITQDYRLNLIVCAEFDTLVNGAPKTYAAVYKIDLVSANHQIGQAPIKRLLPRTSDLNRPQLKYTGAAAFYDNSFYITRTGSNNTSFVDPDNSILIFHPKKFYSKGEGDTLIGRVPNIDPLSSGLVSANQISSISAFNQKNIDFIITLTGNNSFKTQWLQYIVTPLDAKYESRFRASDGVSFVKPGRFKMPEGVTIDNSGNIYVADAGLDSVFKFNAFGDELQAIGGFETTAKVNPILSEPHAVAYFDRIVYVADTGHNRIVRYILSTDLR